MHIKSVTLHGFKSYKDQTTIDLSPQCNLVVGRNGAGKSNFFDAIRFVLGDTNQNLRPEERQALLHEGAGLSVMSAFVELVFDNTDNRFPIDKEEVVLRRSIGLKKDEYFLDKKHVTKTDVANLLESAGFSKSNPYYIVQQGKITGMTLMKDSQRLELLKEVAGTKVYDERRSESMTIMKDTESRRNKVVEVVEYIESRLGELEDEKEELREFQTVDRERRALEYSLYDQELKQIREQLTTVDQDRNDVAESLSELHDTESHTVDQVAALDAKRAEAAAEATALAYQKKIQVAEVAELVQTKARLELDVKEMEEQLTSDDEKKHTVEKELADIEKQINTANSKLQKIEPTFDAELEKEAETIKELEDTERGLNDLYAKQGRATQFESKQARDAWLKKEVATLDKNLKKQKKEISELSTEVSDLEANVESAERKRESNERRVGEVRQSIDQCARTQRELKSQRDAISNERKELWRAQTEVEAKLETAKGESTKYERALNHAFGRDATRGLDAVRRLVAEKKVSGKGVFGPLIELFEVDDKFVTSVEVTASGSLSHVVVDNEKTAARLVERLNTDKLGRVTFIPLDDIHPTDSTGSGLSQDVISMKSRLRYEPKYEKAFTQVFGKTMIARDMHVAAQFSREQNINCITLEGDQVNKKGAITGGYYEPGRSRIASMKKLKNAQQAEGALMESHSDVKKKLDSSEKRIGEILQSIQKNDSERRAKRQELDELGGDTREQKQEGDADRVTMEAKLGVLEQVEKSYQQAETNRNSLRKEIGTDLITELSARDKQAVTDLNAKTSQLKKKLSPLQKERVRLENQKTGLETLLRENLEKQQEELLERLAQIGNGDALSSQMNESQVTQESLDNLKQELTARDAEVKAAAKRLSELEKQLEASNKKQQKFGSDIDMAHKDDTAGDTQKTKLLAEMEGLMSKRSNFLAQKKQVMRNIRELGSLPADAFEKLSNMKKKELLKKLHKANEKLKKYEHVNKKALDQYVNFTEQRDQLKQRLAELDTSNEAINRLVTTLDQRKDEAIQRTFKGVSKHFTEVFRELVPAGKAAMVMIKKRNRDDDDDDDGEDEGQEQAEGMLKYAGVAIKVSFTGTGEVFLLSQLSGGQKSLVALAFIFAIQRLDPAPFYLMDEIDANLDAAHRTAVANLLRKQASQASTAEDGSAMPGVQFVCSTFSPQLLAAANSCFGVYVRNKVSFIRNIEEQAALEFVVHEQKVPPANSAKPAAKGRKRSADDDEDEAGNTSQASAAKGSATY